MTMVCGICTLRLNTLPPGHPTISSNLSPNLLSTSCHHLFHAYCVTKLFQDQTPGEGVKCPKCDEMIVDLEPALVIVPPRDEEGRPTTRRSTPTATVTRSSPPTQGFRLPRTLTPVVAVRATPGESSRPSHQEVLINQNQYLRTRIIELEEDNARLRYRLTRAEPLPTAMVPPNGPRNGAGQPRGGRRGIHGYRHGSRLFRFSDFAQMYSQVDGLRNNVISPEPGSSEDENQFAPIRQGVAASNISSIGGGGFVTATSSSASVTDASGSGLEYDSDATTESNLDPE